MTRAVVVLVAASLLASVTPAAANDTSTQASTTIRLLSTVVSHRVVDRPPKTRANKGDVVYIRDVLRNQVTQFGKPKGALVGHDSAVFRLVSATRARMTAKVTLPGGTLTVKGQIIGTTSSGVIPVVAGTGAFAGARGTCSVRDGTGYSINVYRLRLP